jgi:hypothetical protein
MTADALHFAQTKREQIAGENAGKSALAKCLL